MSRLDFVSGMDADPAYQWDTKQTVHPGGGMHSTKCHSSVGNVLLGRWRGIFMARRNSMDSDRPLIWMWITSGEGDERGCSV